MSYEIENGGYTFRVDFEHDSDSEPPWTDDGHGPVSDWETRAKRPGELILNKGRHDKRFYDFAEACKIALRDGWNMCKTPAEAAEAARSDYEYLRAWSNDEWHYIGVIVTLLNPDGSDSGVSEACWRVESYGDYKDVVARELSDSIVTGDGDWWHSASEVRYVTL